MNLKKIIGYILVFLHSISIPLTLIIILFIKNFYINYILLVYFTILIFGWVFFGNCILTPLENYLLGHDISYDDGTTKSHIILILEKYTGLTTKQVYLALTYLPIFVIFIFLIKFYILCYSSYKLNENIKINN